MRGWAPAWLSLPNECMGLGVTVERTSVKRDEPKRDEPAHRPARPPERDEPAHRLARPLGGTNRPIDRLDPLSSFSSTHNRNRSCPRTPYNHNHKRTRSRQRPRTGRQQPCVPPVQPLGAHRNKIDRFALRSCRSPRVCSGQHRPSNMKTCHPPRNYTFASKKIRPSRGRSLQRQREGTRARAVDMT